MGVLISKDTLSNLSDSDGTEDEGRTTSPDWPISVETPEPAGWRGTGWKGVMSNSFSLLANVDWDRTFWKPTNANEIMHTLGIKGEDGAKGIAAFWVFGKIEYAALSLGSWKSWNIKVICNQRR